MSAVALRFYAYVVIDKAAPESQPLAVVLSRREGRAFVESQPHDRQRTLRVRRAKVTLYES